jgi:hypothetical protein
VTSISALSVAFLTGPGQQKASFIPYVLSSHQHQRIDWGAGRFASISELQTARRVGAAPGCDLASIVQQAVNAERGPDIDL